MRPALRAVDARLARHRAEPTRRGEGSTASGHPHALTAQERKLSVNLVLAERRAKDAVRRAVLSKDDGAKF